MGRFIALYAGYVAALHLVDGPWRRWEKGEVVDAWTLTHVAWGVLARRLGLSSTDLLVLELVNELGEAWVRENRPDLLFGSPEAPLNIATDFASTYIGWRLGG